MFNKLDEVEILVGQHEGKVCKIVGITTELGGLVLYHVLITDIKPSFTMAYKESEIKLI